MQGEGGGGKLQVRKRSSLTERPKTSLVPLVLKTSNSNLNNAEKTSKKGNPDANIAKQQRNTERKQTIQLPPIIQFPNRSVKKEQTFQVRRSIKPYKSKQQQLREEAAAKEREEEERLEAEKWKNIILDATTNSQSKLQEYGDFELDFTDVKEQFTLAIPALFEQLNFHRDFVRIFKFALPKRSVCEKTMQGISKSLNLLERMWSLSLDMQYSYPSSKSWRLLSGCLEAKCTNLRVLKLGFKWCKVDLRKVNNLLSSIQQTSEHLSVLKLDLSFNELGGKGFGCLFERLSTLRGLKLLNIDVTMNDIGSEGLLKASNYLPRFAKTLDSLTLKLKMNKIEDSGFCPFVRSIAKLKQLKLLRMELQSNEISNEGFQHLCEGLLQLQALQYLILNVYENSVDREQLHLLTSTATTLQSLLHFEFVYERCIMNTHSLVCHVDTHTNILTNQAHAMFYARKKPYIKYLLVAQSVRQSKVAQYFRSEIVSEIIGFI